MASTIITKYDGWSTADFGFWTLGTALLWNWGDFKVIGNSVFTLFTFADFVDFAVFGADGFRVALADTATLDLAALMETVGGSATSAIIAWKEIQTFTDSDFSSVITSFFQQTVKVDHWIRWNTWRAWKGHVEVDVDLVNPIYERSSKRLKSIFNFLDKFGEGSMWFRTIFWEDVSFRGLLLTIFRNKIMSYWHNFMKWETKRQHSNEKRTKNMFVSGYNWATLS